MEDKCVSSLALAEQPVVPTKGRRQTSTLLAGREWRTFEEAMDLYLTVVAQPVRQAVASWFPSSGAEWFDVHARKGMRCLGIRFFVGHRVEPQSSRFRSGLGGLRTHALQAPRLLPRLCPTATRRRATLSVGGLSRWSMIIRHKVLAPQEEDSEVVPQPRRELHADVYLVKGVT